MAMIVKEFRTEKGKVAISFNGYSYRFVRTAVDGAQYWRCLDDTCSGRAMTDALDVQDFLLKTQHNHPGDKDLATIRMVRETLRRRAGTELTTMPEIYREEQQRLASNPTAAAQLLTFRSIQSTMYKDRLTTLPALPLTRRAIVIPPAYRVTTTSNRFLLASGPGRSNDFLIFSTDDNLRRLCNSSTLYMDGTFDVVPTALFTQLYTIHAFVSNTMLPLVYILMADKSTGLYEGEIYCIK
jgi:hypothetical protein